MSVEFEPTLVELTQRGATSGLLYEANKRLIGLCVDEILLKIDRAAQNGSLDAGLAIGFCHEIAALRRILYRHQQEIGVGRAAARRLNEETHGTG